MRIASLDVVGFIGYVGTIIFYGVHGSLVSIAFIGCLSSNDSINDVGLLALWRSAMLGCLSSFGSIIYIGLL